MRFWQFSLLLAAALPLVCACAGEHRTNGQVQRVTLCQLAHLGPSSNGKLYKTSAIYSTTYRHGAYLVSTTKPRCIIQLGMAQSDVDGSVARFDKVLQQTKAKHGLGAARSVSVVLVFHWVKSGPGHELDAFGRPWSARGVVEVQRVVSSSYYPAYPN